MGDIRYRLYLDNAPATREQLDQIDEISVQQTVDTVWEARLLIPIFTDDRGVWSGADTTFAASFGRVRVEIDAGDGVFVPLIDGPIVGSDQAMSAEPGQSTRTAIVQDDSVYLNRADRVFRFEQKLDHEIAAQIYGDAEQIAETDIDTSTKPPADDIPLDEVQRGTEMQVLRRLASRQGMHAYVLPGPEPGTSIGAFKPFPTEPDGLPPLILLGGERNVQTFTVREDAQGPATVSAQSLSITDKTVTRATANVRDVELLGEEAAAASLKDEAKRILPPGSDGAVDANAAVKAAAQKLSYAFEAGGSVSSECYGAALIPYRVVTLKGVNDKLSGDYVIKSVNHRLTRSAYEQSFSLLRNATSNGGAASEPLGIF
jgi:hypothetical protein